MLKNTSSQSIVLFAFDATTGLPKTGDAANMVFYVTKDRGTVTAISSNSGVPTEMDSALVGHFLARLSGRSRRCAFVVLTDARSLNLGLP
jgi:hypothetical protein